MLISQKINPIFIFLNTKIALCFLLGTVIVGCSSPVSKDLKALIKIEKTYNPPNAKFLTELKNSSLAELEKIDIQPSEINKKWWKTYMLSQAKKTSAPKESCNGFKGLSEDFEFPLRDLALLRAYQVCPQSEKLAELPKELSPWFRELTIEIKLQEALETPDIKDDVAAFIEKAHIETSKKTKEELLLKALALTSKITPKEESELTQKQIQNLLYKNSPRLNPDPADKDLSAVAMDFRFHRDFDKALAIYKKIVDNPKSSSEEIFQTLKNVRMTYKVAQKRNDYIQATSELVRWAKDEFKKNKNDRKAAAHLHDTQTLLAKTLWTEDQSSQGMQILKETQKLLQGLYPMDEVYYIMGRMEEEKGHFKKASEYFDAAVKQPTSLAGLRNKLLWFTAWNAYKMADYKEAKLRFEQMKSAAKDPVDIARARFWLSRTLSQLNEKDLAAIELTALTKEDPLGYYGMLAYRELGLTFPDLGNVPASENKHKKQSLLEVSEINQRLRMSIEWLIAVNEKNFAEKALNEATETLKKDKVSSEPIWLAISSAYARSGLYMPLFSILGSLQPDVKEQIINESPELLFPQPFKDIITEASIKSEIPPEFIYAIIRQESAFNPEARSPVDAFGLMQLLPSISKKLADTYNLQFKEALDLYKPEINIPLGAFELKTLMKKYNGQYILAVSGYNANDSAIRGWLSTRFRPDPLEFIEDVPYEETRTYIKLTMRNYVFYRRLLSPGIKVNFPEELLKLKASN